jgi:probable F420-dependent oxidoreductase
VKIGVVFPQTEIGADRGAVRSYAEAISELGYHHILAYDHVVGADTRVHKAWSGPYDLRSTFHEPFVLFGYLAAVSPVELVTGIVILPQRQTALVAKQAAQVDLLSGGRFRLGVGIGWNAVEYEALDKDFANRGQRIAEQVELMRRLWTEDSVTFEGRFETVTGAGLAPLPIQRPIPIWFGATSPPALRRVGQIADGWFPLFTPGPRLDEALSIIEKAALETGREPETIGMEGFIDLGPGGLDHLEEQVASWRGVRATHVSFNTMKEGLTSVDEHVALLAAAADVLADQ